MDRNPNYNYQDNNGHHRSRNYNPSHGSRQHYQRNRREEYPPHQQQHQQYHSVHQQQHPHQQNSHQHHPHQPPPSPHKDSQRNYHHDVVRQNFDNGPYRQDTLPPELFPLSVAPPNAANMIKSSSMPILPPLELSSKNHSANQHPLPSQFSPNYQSSIDQHLHNAHHPDFNHPSFPNHSRLPPQEQHPSHHHPPPHHPPPQHPPPQHPPPQHPPPPHHPPQEQHPPHLHHQHPPPHLPPQHHLQHTPQQPPEPPIQTSEQMKQSNRHQKRSSYHGSEKKNYRLAIDPMIVPGAQKGYCHFTIDDPETTFQQMDPRNRTKKIWARKEIIWLTHTKFKQDKYFVGRVEPKEVTFENLNDNINRDFLKDMCLPFGDISECAICYHPKTHKHLGIAKVLYVSTSSSKECVKALNGCSKMGNIIKVYIDPKGTIRSKAVNMKLNPLSSLPKVNSDPQIRHEYQTSQAPSYQESYEAHQEGHNIHNQHDSHNRCNAHQDRHDRHKSQEKLEAYDNHHQHHQHQHPPPPTAEEHQYPRSGHRRDAVEDQSTHTTTPYRRQATAAAWGKDIVNYLNEGEDDDERNSMQDDLAMDEPFSSNRHHGGGDEHSSNAIGRDDRYDRRHTRRYSETDSDAVRSPLRSGVDGSPPRPYTPPLPHTPPLPKKESSLMPAVSLSPQDDDDIADGLEFESLEDRIQSLLQNNAMENNEETSYHSLDDIINSPLEQFTSSYPVAISPPPVLIETVKPPLPDISAPPPTPLPLAIELGAQNSPPPAPVELPPLPEESPPPCLTSTPMEQSPPPQPQCETPPPLPEQPPPPMEFYSDVEYPQEIVECAEIDISMQSIPMEMETSDSEFSDDLNVAPSVLLNELTSLPKYDQYGKNEFTHEDIMRGILNSDFSDFIVDDDPEENSKFTEQELVYKRYYEKYYCDQLRQHKLTNRYRNYIRLLPNCQRLRYARAITDYARLNKSSEYALREFHHYWSTSCAKPPCVDAECTYEQRASNYLKTYYLSFHEHSARFCRKATCRDVDCRTIRECQRDNCNLAYCRRLPPSVDQSDPSDECDSTSSSSSASTSDSFSSSFPPPGTSDESIAENSVDGGDRIEEEVMSSDASETGYCRKSRLPNAAYAKVDISDSDSPTEYHVQSERFALRKRMKRRNFSSPDDATSSGSCSETSASDSDFSIDFDSDFSSCFSMSSIDYCFRSSLSSSSSSSSSTSRSCSTVEDANPTSQSPGNSSTTDSGSDSIKRIKIEPADSPVEIETSPIDEAKHNSISDKIEDDSDVNVSCGVNEKLNVCNHVKIESDNSIKVEDCENEADIDNDSLRDINTKIIETEMVIKEESEINVKVENEININNIENEADIKIENEISIKEENTSEIDMESDVNADNYMDVKTEVEVKCVSSLFKDDIEFDVDKLSENEDDELTLLKKKILSELNEEIDREQNTAGAEEDTDASEIDEQCDDVVILDSIVLPRDTSSSSSTTSTSISSVEEYDFYDHRPHYDSCGYAYPDYSDPSDYENDLYTATPSNSTRLRSKLWRSDEEWLRSNDFVNDYHSEGEASLLERPRNNKDGRVRLHQGHWLTNRQGYSTSGVLATSKRRLKHMLFLEKSNGFTPKEVQAEKLFNEYYEKYFREYNKKYQTDHVEYRHNYEMNEITKDTFAKCKPLKIVFKEIMDELCEGIQVVVRKDLIKRIIETTGFTTFQNWWSDRKAEYEQNIVQEGNVDVPASENTKPRDTKQMLSEILEVQKRGRVFGQGGLLGIPRMPKIKKKIEETADDEDDEDDDRSSRDSDDETSSQYSSDENSSYDSSSSEAEGDDDEEGERSGSDSSSGTSTSSKADVRVKIFSEKSHIIESDLHSSSGEESGGQLSPHHPKSPLPQSPLVTSEFASIPRIRDSTPDKAASEINDDIVNNQLKERADLENDVAMTLLQMASTSKPSDLKADSSVVYESNAILSETGTDTASASEGEQSLQKCLPTLKELMDHLYCKIYHPVIRRKDPREMIDENLHYPSEKKLVKVGKKIEADRKKLEEKKKPKRKPPKQKFTVRSQHQEDEILHEFQKVGLYPEDALYLQKQYDHMLGVEDKSCTWIHDTHWMDNRGGFEHNLPLKKRKHQYRSNPTGCARSEGYYRIPQDVKDTYLEVNRSIPDPIKKDVERNEQKAIGHLPQDEYVPYMAGIGLSEQSQQMPTVVEPPIIEDLDAEPGKKKQEKSREARSESRRWQNVINQIDGFIDGDLLKFNQLKYRKKNLQFARSDIHDWGLYACEPIAADEMVVEYVGQVVRSPVADLRERVYEQKGIGSSYLFRIDDETIIDATKFGNMARFINHCCAPNCYAKIINVEEHKKIVIYSRRDISINEEVTYDYKFPIEDKKIHCHCGSVNCRGTLN